MLVTYPIAVLSFLESKIGRSFLKYLARFLERVGNLPLCLLAPSLGSAFVLDSTGAVQDAWFNGQAGSPSAAAARQE